MRIESTRLVVNSIDQDDILYTTLKKCLECKVCSCISDNIVDCEYCHTSYCLSCAKKIKKCPHMKCNLVFNDEEKTWDCPCHGSRFDLDGKCIEGPSNYDISYKNKTK